MASTVMLATCPTASERSASSGTGKVRVDRVKLLQGHEARAHRDILPEIDIAEAEPAGERSLDGLLGDDGARPLNGRRRRVAGRERCVDGRLGGVALSDKRLLAGKRRIGVLQLRKAVGEIGLLDRIVDIDEQRARFDVFTRIEMLRCHHPRLLRSDKNALVGAQRPDRRQLGWPVFDFHHFGRHRRRLRRKGGADEPLHQVRLDGELEVSESGGQRREQNQHNQEHDRASRDERQPCDDEQQRQYRPGREEGERGKGNVNMPKLRRRAERDQHQGEEDQDPVRQAPHGSICNIFFRIDTSRGKICTSELRSTPRQRAPSPLCLNSWPQRGGLIREIYQ
jgi:hypothetical protein